jgi:hypothetical protein
VIFTKKCGWNSINNLYQSLGMFDYLVSGLVCQRSVPGALWLVREFGPNSQLWLSDSGPAVFGSSTQIASQGCGLGVGSFCQEFHARESVLVREFDPNSQPGL